ncbi:hypothetical protein DFH27DRAFT_20127 [Peziza echinospora]|nr:hypothetical protein DFH27DRAFT_20127 [Peziza echinospora]
MQPQLLPVITAGFLAILLHTPLVSALVVFSNTPTPTLGEAIPLALTMPPRTSCPATMITCNAATAEESLQTHCCPSGNTCIKKPDVFGVQGWGCCDTSDPTAKCGSVIETTKCAAVGWSVCGGGEGGKCCASRGLCRSVNEGGLKWDCGGSGNGTEGEGTMGPIKQSNGTGPGNLTSEEEKESGASRSYGSGVGRFTVVVVGVVVGLCSLAL